MTLIANRFYSLSSGIAAGNLGEAGATATINVTTQNVSGIIRGRVLDSGNGQSPVPNSLVVARAYIPGFPTPDNLPITVGYAFTAQDGSFTIDRLPIGTIYLAATDPQRGITTSQTVQLTPQNTPVEGVILLVSNGFGRVLGKVVNEIGQVIPNAVVQEGARAVQADAAGNVKTHADGRGGIVETLEYDALNQAKQIRDGAGNITKFEYDGGGLI